MSLYYEAAAILANESNTGGSLKNRIFNATRVASVAKDGVSKNRSSKIAPQQLYALIAESTKWSKVLSEVIENAQLLELERKLTPVLALLLTHDLLLAKKGLQAPAGHVLATAVSKHKGRLISELSRIRIKRRYPTLDDFRAAIEAGVENTEESNEPQPARWVRINTLIKSDGLAEKELADFDRLEAIKDVTTPSNRTIKKSFHVDQHIPNLLAMSRRIDMSKTNMYKKGQIILQDKASCFPAYLLDPASTEGDIIDACAAPGNKTTHLAALLAASSDASGRRVFACERDKQRSRVLQLMVGKAGINDIVHVLANTDFLSLRPNDERFRNVGALLLDPSCSGSGIVGRDDGPPLILPKGIKSKNASSTNPAAQPSKKRKRGDDKEANGNTRPKVKPMSTPLADDSLEDNVEEEAPIVVDSAEALQTRLTQLSAFQLKLLTHAMSFPAAKRITYSTCSTHYLENESVVIQALQSSVARARGWNLMPRSKQVKGMRKWHVRGDRQACIDEGGIDVHLATEVSSACLRTTKGTVDGTMGFFVACFERDGSLDGPTIKAKPASHNQSGASILDVGEASQMESNDDTENDTAASKRNRRADESEEEEEEGWGDFDDEDDNEPTSEQADESSTAHSAVSTSKEQNMKTRTIGRDLAPRRSTIGQSRLRKGKRK